jgi:hypothetical protein
MKPKRNCRPMTWRLWMKKLKDSGSINLEIHDIKRRQTISAIQSLGRGDRRERVVIGSWVDGSNFFSEATQTIIV